MERSITGEVLAQGRLGSGHLTLHDVGVLVMLVFSLQALPGELTLK
jgi:hypothetical protein